jgi:hypothetical protein
MPSDCIVCAQPLAGTIVWETRCEPEHHVLHIQCALHWIETKKGPVEDILCFQCRTPGAYAGLRRETADEAAARQATAEAIEAARLRELANPDRERLNAARLAGPPLPQDHHASDIVAVFLRGVVNEPWYNPSVPNFRCLSLNIFQALRRNTETNHDNISQNGFIRLVTNTGVNVYLALHITLTESILYIYKEYEYDDTPILPFPIPLGSLIPRSHDPDFRAERWRPEYVEWFYPPETDHDFTLASLGGEVERIMQTWLAINDVHVTNIELLKSSWVGLHMGFCPERFVTHAWMGQFDLIKREIPDPHPNSDDNGYRRSYVDEGFDINARGERRGITALMAAVQGRRSREVVELLIQNGANVNEQTRDGLSALMCAASRTVNDMWNQNIDVIDQQNANLLIGAGADINALDRLGRTALQIAQESNNLVVKNCIEVWQMYRGILAS